MMQVTAEKNRVSNSPHPVQFPFLLFLGCVLTFYSGLVQAQEDRIPTFRIESFSTLHEVRVMNPDGHMVEGLKKEDFLVYEDNQICAVRYFEERREVPVSIVVLLDIGSSMNSEQIRAAKKAIRQLIHLLDPEDEILIAVYDREFHPLTPLTTDRHDLTDGVTLISPGARRSFWSRLASGFSTSAHTGYAIDIASLKLEEARHENRVILVFSAAFGNVGVATQEHLALADVRLFGVKWPNKLGDALNFWGDWVSRGRLLESSGGIQFSGKGISEEVKRMAESIKSYYLIAYKSFVEDGELEETDVQFKIKDHSNYRVFASRKAPSARNLVR